MKKIILAAAMMAVVSAPAFAAPEAFTIDLNNNGRVVQSESATQMGGHKMNRTAGQQQMQQVSDKAAEATTASDETVKAPAKKHKGKKHSAKKNTATAPSATSTTNGEAASGTNNAEGSMKEAK